MMRGFLMTLVLTCGVSSGVGQTPTFHDPGMYVKAGTGYIKVMGQIAEFRRTGSRLVSSATVGIKSAKINIQLPGPHAQTVVSPQPVFYFIPPKQEAAAGVNAGDLILIRLEEKTSRRQFEVGAAGLFRASSGISLTHQIQLLRSEPTPEIYEITPAVELSKGEYALYLARGEGMAPYIYDFGVQGVRTPRVTQGVTPRPAGNGSDSVAHKGGDSGDISEVAGGLNLTPSGEQKNSPRAMSDSASTLSAGTPAQAAPSSHGGVLGITGADWDQGEVRGVEVLEVSDDSSAQLAGLRKGYVITAVNGVPVHSTTDLGRLLAQMEPGSRINVAYLYKSNLGWMPQETAVVLQK